MRRSLLLIGIIAAAIATAVAQEPPTQKPFTESVEVRVRTVLVFITDAKGKPLAKAPMHSNSAPARADAPRRRVQDPIVIATDAGSSACAAAVQWHGFCNLASTHNHRHRSGERPVHSNFAAKPEENS